MYTLLITYVSEAVEIPEALLHYNRDVHKPKHLHNFFSGYHLVDMQRKNTAYKHSQDVYFTSICPCILMKEGSYLCVALPLNGVLHCLILVFRCLNLFAAQQ